MSAEKSDALLREHQPRAIARRLDGPYRVSVLPDAILGAIDGCVTTFAIVAGATGAGFSATVALVLGGANLVADGFSMAISNFEAARAQRDHANKLRQQEQEHIAAIPEGEREEVRQIYRRKGFNGPLLEDVVKTISDNKALWIETMLREEHGLAGSTPQPFRSALATFSAFVLVGIFPLLPFAFDALGIYSPGHSLFAWSAALAALMFFLVGMLKSALLGLPIWRSATQTLISGGTAAALAFFSGYVLRQVFGIDSV